MQKAIFPNMLKVAQVKPIYDLQKKEIYSSSKITDLFQCYQYLVNSLKKLFIVDYTVFLRQKYYLWPTIWLWKHHSTSHAINYSVNLILDGIQSQKHALGIFINLSKAFDTINHGILLVM